MKLQKQDLMGAWSLICRVDGCNPSFVTLPGAQFQKPSTAARKKALQTSAAILHPHSKDLAGEHGRKWGYRIMCDLEGEIIGLDLSYKNLSSLPQDIFGKFPFLRALDVSNSFFDKVPDFSQNLKLEYLYLRCTKLTGTPRFDDNPELKGIYSEITLDKVPDFSKNQKLEYLYLSTSSLKEAPDVSQNPNLKYLSLANTQITQAPDLTCNPKLEVLSLLNTKLAEPPDVSQNPNLLELNCYLTPLQKGPNLSNNRELKHLSLQATKIEQLPDLSNNTKLELLGIGYTLITHMPDLSKHVHLRFIDIRASRMSSKEWSRFSAQAKKQSIKMMA